MLISALRSLYNFGKLMIRKEFAHQKKIKSVFFEGEKALLLLLFNAAIQECT